MTEYSYQPPKRELEDTLLAFQDFQKINSGIRCTVKPDPLGTVNRIISIEAHGKAIKSVLWPVPAGVTVKLGTGGSRYTPFGGPHDEQYKAPHWWVEVNERRILEVPEHETWPDHPAPPVPWRTRLPRHTHKLGRTVADRIAHKFGYIHPDEQDWNQ